MRFADQLEAYIVKSIQTSFVFEEYTTETLHRIKALITEKINNIFSRSKYQLSNDSITWLAGEFFRRLTINGELVEKLIIMNEIDMTTLPFSDIMLMKDLFNQTGFGPKLLDEYSRRTVS